MHQIRLSEIFKNKRTNFPSDPQLLPTQLTALRYLMRIEYYIGMENHLQGCIFGDDMGSGKTLVLTCLIMVNKVKSTIIIAPKTTTSQLLKLLVEVLSPKFKIYKFDGHLSHITLDNDGEPVSSRADIMRSPYVLVTDRDQLITKNFKEQMESKVWERMIIDEAHVYRNETEYDRGFQNIIPAYEMEGRNRIQTMSKILVTGTPYQNDRSDFVKLFKIIDKNIELNISDAKLLELTKRYLFRRSLYEYTDEMKRLMNFPLFDPEIITIYVEPKDTKLSTEVERMNWQEIFNKYEEDSKFRSKIIKDEKAYILACIQKNFYFSRNALTGLKIYLSDPFRINIFENFEISASRDKMSQPIYEGRNSKVEEFIKILEEDDISSFVVFHENTYSREMYKRGISELNDFEIFEIDGTIANDVRNRRLIECKSAKRQGSRVILFSSIRATSEGINYQEISSKVIFIDQNANPQEEKQAIARVYRMGQSEEVKVWFICYPDFITTQGTANIDTRLKDIKEEKAELARYLNINAATYFKRYYVIGEDGEKTTGLIENVEYSRYYDTVGPDDIIEFSKELYLKDKAEYDRNHE